MARRLRGKGSHGATTPQRKVERRDLWKRYRANRDDAAREELLTISLRLVHQAAHTVLRGGKRRLGYEELVSAGTIGLVEALERFDPDAGVSFHYYAALRIRGAMLDALRKESGFSRTHLKRCQLIQRARAHLTQTRGRPPHETEIAEALNMPLARYWRLLGELHRAPSVPIALDESCQMVEAQMPADGPFEAAVRHTDMQERIRLLRRVLPQLPERERYIVTLYYFDGFLQREIGQVLGITEGRVCQLLRRALHRLRGTLEAIQASEVQGSRRLAA